MKKENSSKHLVYRFTISYQVILEATNNTEKGKVRDQDSRQNRTATVLLIFFFHFSIFWGVDFISFNKIVSKINMYSLY